jgi:dCTP deaminase
MLATDREIRHLLRRGEVVVSPPPSPEDIRPVGIRLRLGLEVMIPLTDGPSNSQEIDLRNPESAAWNRVELGSNGFVLRPGDFVLGSTLETIKISSRWIGVLDGRSSLARLGLGIHATSLMIDNLHGEGRSIVLELKNLGPFGLRLFPRVAIGMLCFVRLSSRIRQDPSGQYEGQVRVIGPLKGLAK